MCVGKEALHNDLLYAKDACVKNRYFLRGKEGLDDSGAVS
jgi:hypothetical protein